MMRWICALEPTSMPCVGSSRISTRGRRSRATWRRRPSAGCRPRAARPSGRCPVARRRRWRSPRRRPRARAAESVMPRRARRAEDRQGDVGDDALGHDQALAVAILGQVGEAAPQHLAAGCAARPAAVEQDAARRSAASCRSRPGRSRERPAPTSPAMPTISPARTAKETSAKTPSSAEALDAAAPPAPALAGLALGEQRLERAADHHLHDARPRSTSRAGRVATCAPSRSTVTSSAISVELLEPVGDQHHRRALGRAGRGRCGRASPPRPASAPRSARRG